MCTVIAIVSISLHIGRRAFANIILAYLSLLMTRLQGAEGALCIAENYGRLYTPTDRLRPY